MLPDEGPNAISKDNHNTDNILPIHETVKNTNKNGPYRKRSFQTIVGFLLIIGVSIAAGALVSLHKQQGDGMAKPDGSAQKDESLRQSIIRSKIEYLNSNSSVFDDPTSPQGLALTWLAKEDAADIDEDDQARLETRFALAELYFATQGETWNDRLRFLTGVHECYWTSSTYSADKSPRGIECNSDEQVIGLTFGTYLWLVLLVLFI
jgi:hypothetical protein